MTPSGIEPATFRFEAQYLNHCATAVPPLKERIDVYSEELVLLFTSLHGVTLLKTLTFSKRDI
jgi:hypothetical protein